MNQVTEVFEKLTSINLENIKWTDGVEIVILAILIYYVLLWIKTTRAWSLVKGFAVIFVFLLFAVFFELDTILWLAGNIFDIGVIALVIVFQPELRKALEQLGQKNIIADILTLEGTKEKEEHFNTRTIDAIVKACVEMSKVKTGALIVIENNVPLGEYERTGITLDAQVSATCYLPLSDNMTLSKELGTRHRAAVGISEVSDAMTVVVSEETGAISITQYSEIKRNVTAETLKEQLSALQNKTTEGKRFRLWKGREKDEVKADR